MTYQGLPITRTCAAFGVIPRDAAEPNIRWDGMGEDPFPADEVSESGVLCITVNQHGDDPSGLFLRVDAVTEEQARFTYQKVAEDVQKAAQHWMDRVEAKTDAGV